MQLDNNLQYPQIPGLLHPQMLQFPFLIVAMDDQTSQAVFLSSQSQLLQIVVPSLPLWRLPTK